MGSWGKQYGGGELFDWGAVMCVGASGQSRKGCGEGILMGGDVFVKWFYTVKCYR